MATKKVSLTLDGDALKEARKRVGRRGLSGYVDTALKRQLQHDRLRGLLAELQAEYGPVPDRIKREVRRQWRADTQPRQPKSRRA